MNAKNKWNRITRSLFIVSLMAALFTLQGCSKSSDPPPVTNANPAGYYDVTGTATVDDGSGGTLGGAGGITDLQGMVNGTRFIAMSDAADIAYDGTITNITGNAFTATVSIYQTAAFVSSASISGTITTGSSITGTVSGSTGAGNGTFSLTYATTNNEVAALSRVENTTNSDWSETYGVSPNLISGLAFKVNATGNIGRDFNPTQSIFAGCEVTSGTISPIAATNLYTITFTLTLCTNVNLRGTYEGLASTRAEMSTDDTMPLVLSKTDFSVYGNYD